jgi:hypothetical protein
MMLVDASKTLTPRRPYSSNILQMFAVTSKCHLLCETYCHQRRPTLSCPCSHRVRPSSPQAGRIDHQHVQRHRVQGFSGHGGLQQHKGSDYHVYPFDGSAVGAKGYQSQRESCFLRLGGCLPAPPG